MTYMLAIKNGNIGSLYKIEEILIVTNVTAPATMGNFLREQGYSLFGNSGINHFAIQNRLGDAKRGNVSFNIEQEITNRFQKKVNRIEIIFDTPVPTENGLLSGDNIYLLETDRPDDLGDIVRITDQSLLPGFFAWAQDISSEEIILVRACNASLGNTTSPVLQKIGFAALDVIRAFAPVGPRTPLLKRLMVAIDTNNLAEVPRVLSDATNLFKQEN